MLRGLSNAEPPENLVNVIFEESQGNPFFVEEVYRHLLEEGKVFDAAGKFRADFPIDEVDVPENVRLIVSRRLERLDDNEKRALAAAAVIGRSFSFQLVTAISQIDIDELFAIFEKAQQMGIIVASAEGPEKPFTFAHELVRQTLLAGISMPRKQQLHASVADAIEQQCSNANGCAGEITDHLIKAGSFADRKRLIRWLIHAGQTALDSSAFDEARRSFKSALSQQGATEPAERAHLLASLAMAELGLDRWESAVASLREALEIYIGLGDREMIGKSFTELADAFIWVGRLSEAAETARRGLAYLERDISPHRVRLLADLGQAIAAGGNLEPACDALQEALTIASRLADPQLEARVLAARSIVRLHFFELRDGAMDGLRAEELSAAGASPWQRALQLRILHQTLLYLGRVQEALKIGDELEPLAIKIGQSYSAAICVNTRACVEFGKEPDLAKVETSFQEVWRAAQRSRFAFWQVVSDVQLSFLDYVRGNWKGALAHAQDACRSDRWTSIRGLGEGMLFRQMAYAGDRDGALAILNEKRGWLPTSGQKNTRGSWWLLALVVEGLAMLGERSQAGELYPMVRELLDTGAVALWAVARFTQTIAGIAAAAADNWEAAEEHFKLALQQAESFPNKLEQAEIRRFRAMMLIDRGARGDREKARTLLAETRETYTGIGMPRHIAMTKALLD
jgi:tetratricopeptide (TPR) repeat protein